MSRLGLQAKKGDQTGSNFGPNFKKPIIHRGTKGGGPDPLPPPGSATGIVYRYIRSLP